MKKYEPTGATIENESDPNLSHERDTCIFGGPAKVFGEATVFGDAWEVD